MRPPQCPDCYYWSFNLCKEGWEGLLLKKRIGISRCANNLPDHTLWLAFGRCCTGGRIGHCACLGPRAFPHHHTWGPTLVPSHAAALPGRSIQPMPRPPIRFRPPTALSPRPPHHILRTAVGLFSTHAKSFAHGGGGQKLADGHVLLGDGGGGVVDLGWESHVCSRLTGSDAGASQAFWTSLWWSAGGLSSPLPCC